MPAPVRTAQDVSLAVRRLLAQMRLAAPITAVGITRSWTFRRPRPARPTCSVQGLELIPVALEAVRRRLAARFGLTTLTTPSQWPKSSSPEEARRLSEQRQGAFL